MFDFLYTMPDFYLFSLLGLVSTIISITAITIVKHCVPIDMRYKNNPVIGNIGSLISIIYGVLAGLMALYLINNINYTDDAVQREADAVANIYRDSHWLKEPLRSKIEAQVVNYLVNTIDLEWPLMENGHKVNTDSDLIIDQLSSELSQYPADSKSEQLILPSLLEEIRNLHDSRHQRIHMSEISLNPSIWVVILLGTILTIGINYLFGMDFYLHIITVTACGLMFSAMIYLLITLDRPFQGEFTVEPTPFQLILHSINAHSNKAHVRLVEHIHGTYT